ncbi:calnexin isoform X3 [Tachysurus fulvidraco]|uniref:calnexin isoform X3 n=1 Tax=Tachysurus fulvidraco TaxID=1234273 RepID=UPI001FEF3EA5|nr:calnexin isoform X3 [Tachysurus fulvidraco]
MIMTMIIRQGALIAFCFCSTVIVSREEQAYFAETFDTSPLDRKWVISQSLKEGDLDIHKYDGKWLLEEAMNQASTGNKGLVLKSPGRHHAISAYLRTVYHFRENPLCLQYEVFFQNGIDCGGGYIKLLSDSDDLRLSQFNDATPYTIMFGPDKCGSVYKVHFIIRHRNPLTGDYEEKHARQPDTDLSDYFTDHNPHLYTLNLYPNNTFEILIDQTLINNGSLLEDMDPPVMPPRELEDPEDTKPFNWDDRRYIPDPTITKPYDWDEEAPRLIADPTAQRPHSWIEEQEPFVPDPEAQAPHDWSVEMDGEWEAPLIDNPACSHAAGCGPWKPPMVPNPAYKGKWKPPMIDNPNYQPGVVERLLLATVKRPWLWGVYVFTVGLPIILFISFMWPDKRFGPSDQDYYYKKCDEPQPDSPQDPEGNTTNFTDNGPNKSTGLRKREANKAQKKSDLELKVFK